MVYEEFLKIAKKVASPITERYFQDMITSSFSSKKSGDDKIPAYILAEAEISSVSGGYDNEQHDVYTSPNGFLEVRKYFDDSFDALIMELCPDISFLKYKMLTSLIQSSERVSHGYYGDSTTYAILYISLRHLYDKMVEIKIIE